MGLLGEWKKAMDTDYEVNNYITILEKDAHKEQIHVYEKKTVKGNLSSQITAAMPYEVMVIETCAIT
jgi:hypothetical protein